MSQTDDMPPLRQSYRVPAALVNRWKELRDDIRGVARLQQVHVFDALQGRVLPSASTDWERSIARDMGRILARSREDCAIYAPAFIIHDALRQVETDMANRAALYDLFPSLTNPDTLPPTPPRPEDSDDFIPF